MATKQLMTVEEYLRTTFEGADCDYLEGEVVERNMGELPHGLVQKRLVKLLSDAESRLGVQVVVEIRIQINPQRYRVADIAVWRAGFIGERIPVVPPFLVIEILSAEDRMVRMLPKVHDYLSIGVEWIWLIDPAERKALCYSKQNPAGALCETLRTDNPEIAISLEAALAE